MLVRELIALLQAQNPDDMVMINGYEGGFGRPTPASVQRVAMHDDDWNQDCDYGVDRPTVPVVVISRSAIRDEDRQGDYACKWDTNDMLNY
jgi:hypothetical protein